MLVSRESSCHVAMTAPDLRLMREVGGGSSVASRVAP
jgi:hypothetical protein